MDAIRRVEGVTRKALSLSAQAVRVASRAARGAARLAPGVLAYVQRRSPAEVKRPPTQSRTRSRADRAPQPEPGTDDEIRTPSGIPAADPGYNPSTAETDLLQPGTEPIVDPATAKAVKSESETMRKASERHKE